MKKEKTKILAALGVGAAIGASAGVLLAPRKGSETRKMIVSSIANMKNKVLKLDKESIKKSINKKLNAIENEIAKLEIEENFNKAKKEVKKTFKKIDKLATYAKKKGLNEFEGLILDLKKKVSDISDEVLEKFDK